MPRGDTRSFPLKVPTALYSTGASLFFGMKKNVTDTTLLVPKTLTDDDITSTTDDYKIYTLLLAPSDTLNVTPGTYLAEVEFVSSDGTTVGTFPDPSKAKWQFTISADIITGTS